MTPISRTRVGLLALTSLGFASSGTPALANETGYYMDLNQIAVNSVLYEAQVRTANACLPGTGNPMQQQLCNEKLAAHVVYRGLNPDGSPMSCPIESDLEKIKLGTFEDMLTNDDPKDTSDDPTHETVDPKHAITLNYIRNRVGANVLWLQPIFPNNDTWNIPDQCDNLGSPYAVRDYMHASGMISNGCDAAHLDEHDANSPCWGNASLDQLLKQAGKLHLKVMLDVAFNHFGHNYQMYDYAYYTPTQDWIDQGKDINNLYNADNPVGAFDANYVAENGDALKYPVLLDTEAELRTQAANDKNTQNAINAIQQVCKNQQKPMLTGPALVRAYHMWRNALNWERTNFQCSDLGLEFQAPGFYLGSNAWDPSQHLGDNFTNNWTDVKFLYHHQENPSHEQEFVREREYLFRVLNYWVSRGVAGFRFDHSTDPQGGMGPDEWKYILSKVDYYAAKRNQDKPIYLAEEFGDQMGMSHVVDIMTDGYIGNIRGGNPKDARFLEDVMENNKRFNGHTLVMTALEDHDENRLNVNTGFDHWTGAGFWGAGATTWSTPMILIGQEFGETWGLGFKRNDFLRSRFEGTGNYIGSDFYPLIDYYGKMIKGRLPIVGQDGRITSDPNRALRADQAHYFYLPLKANPAGTPDSRVFAQARWTDDGNVVFTFQNLWTDPQGNDVAQHYYIPPDRAGQMHIDTNVGSLTHYRLCDILQANAPGDCAVVNDCIKGSDLAWDFGVVIPSATRAQWLRLEETQTFCP